MEQTVVRIRTLEIGSGMPKICVPVVGMTEKEILEGAERAKAAKPDLVEFRVDWYEEAADSKKVVALLEKLRKCLGELPVLFTFRSSREGGEAALSDGAYQSLNEAAIASGFVDCVDVELFSGDAVVKAVVAAAHSNNVKVIASNHDFEKTPAAEELLARLQKMEALGADIPKIAVMPQSSKDVLTLLMVTESWKALERLYDEGAVRAIGVCNFLPQHLLHVLKNANTAPMIDQFEFHPGYPQYETLQFCQSRGIQAEAWSPLGRGRLLEDPLVLELAKKYGKSPAQICLRFCLQNNVLPLPKSSAPERMKANLDIFDFEIEQEDIYRLLTRPRTGWSGLHPEHFE